MNELDRIEAQMVSKLEVPIGKPAVLEMADLCIEDVLTLKTFFNLMFHSNPSVCFRASWVLETVSIQQLDRIEPIMADMMIHFSRLKIPSCQRHISRIIILLNKKTSKSSVKQAYLKLDLEPVVETLFSWLVNESTPVAVKANCMEALVGFIPKHVWIKDELLETTEYLSSRESVAFYGRLKKVRQMLKKV